MAAHTYTCTACFATGLYCCSLLIFNLTLLVCLTSCTELSLLHMTSSKESFAAMPLLANFILSTLFFSEIITPVFFLATTE